jgi:hypothetical protein
MTQHRRYLKRTCDYKVGHPERHGSLLLIVLVTIVILSLAVFSFTDLMQVEQQAATVMTRQVQSRYLVDSGVDYLRLYLTQNEDEIFEKGGLWDNEAGNFDAIPVAFSETNPNLIGRFTIVAPNLDDEGVPEGRRFGLVNESAKININALPYFDFYIEDSARGMLMALPNMTEEIADAILDWVDADEEVREYGVEGGFYAGQNPSYYAKNGPIDSLDELLLIRGVTPELLFGLDTNRNGILDDDEAAIGDVSSTEAEMVLGWANYVTLYSKESNRNSEGLDRINVNGDDLEQLYDDLKSAYDDDWANYIIYYRMNGPSAAGPGVGDIPLKASAVPVEIPADEEGSNRFASVLDMVDTYVEVVDETGATIFLESPMLRINLPQVLPIAMQSITVYEGPAIAGRINIMQAPRRVLEGIPNMTEDLIDTIIRVREFELDDPEFLDINRQWETWLLAEQLITGVDLETMKSLMPFICADGDVYRAEIVGYFSDGRGTSRSEVVLDTTFPLPKILFWRNKSHLQTGYSIDALGTGLNVARDQ